MFLREPQSPKNNRKTTVARLRWMYYTQSNQGVIWVPNMSDLISPRRSYIGQSNQNESAMPNGTLGALILPLIYNNISDSTYNSIFCTNILY